MKFLKVLALIMTVCLLATAFVACDNGSDKETEANSADGTTATISVTLVIRNDGTEVARATTTCNGTLADAIEMYCAGEGYEGECFDASTGILTAIGELKAGDGKSWIAYYEDQGKAEAFDSIKTQTVENGKTIVLSLE